MLEISATNDAFLIREVDDNGGILNQRLMKFSELESGVNIFGDYYFDGGIYKQVGDKKYSVRIKLNEILFN